MVHTFIKFKILKLSLLSALSAGIVLTLIAKEMRENKKRTKPTDNFFLKSKDAMRRTQYYSHTLHISASHNNSFGF